MSTADVLQTRNLALLKLAALAMRHWDDKGPLPNVVVSDITHLAEVVEHAERLLREEKA